MRSSRPIRPMIRALPLNRFAPFLLCCPLPPPFQYLGSSGPWFESTPPLRGQCCPWLSVRNVQTWILPSQITDTGIVKRAGRCEPIALADLKNRGAFQEGDGCGLRAHRLATTRCKAVSFRFRLRPGGRKKPGGPARDRRKSIKNRDGQILV
jgi:hypothetical protein